MSYETLSLERDGPVLVARFNRPEKRNAINFQMHRELQRLCHELEEDFDTRVVILSGEGGCFSSGADTSEWGRSGSDNELEVRHVSGIGSRTSDALQNLGQITIAAVEGFAVGGAVVLAVCCDLRVVAEQAWLSIPEVELGIPLSWNALPRLAREVGVARAFELTVLCERFTAQQALDWGVATHLAPAGRALDTARELAAKVVAKPALPVALTKASMKAIKRGTEQGEVAYSDGDLLLYSRLMQRRAARRQERPEGEEA